MAKVSYMSTTVGIDTEVYERLGDLAFLKRTSRRKIISDLVGKLYEENKDSILKLKEITDLEKKVQLSTPNTIAEQS